MIPVEEALQTVLRVARRLQPVAVPLSDALGHVLAEDVLALQPLPPFPASIKAASSLSRALSRAFALFLSQFQLCHYAVSHNTSHNLIL